MNASTKQHKGALAKRTLIVFALVFLFGFLCTLLVISDDRLRSLVDPGPIDIEHQFETTHEQSKRTASPLIVWLSQDYLSQTSPPNVVVFGSSQIGGMRSADAQTAGRNLDIVLDHRGYTIEKLLREKTGKEQTVFVAQQPGTLVADFLVMAQAWFEKPAYQPKTVVVTVTARDFLSDSRPYIGSSSTFQCLSKYSDLGDLTYIIFSSLQSRLHWLISDRIAPRIFASARDNDSAETNKIGSKQEQLKPKQVYFEAKDMQTYLKMKYPQKAYEKPDYYFTNELLCFTRLLEFLDKRHINTVVIGTPLYTIDRAEIDKVCWSRFAPKISDTCTKHHAKFLDLTDSDRFAREDFLDPVHLGLNGGRKLAEQITKAISDL